MLSILRNVRVSAERATLNGPIHSHPIHIRYPCGVSSLSFNSEGDLLAIASSYAFEEGPKEYVHHVLTPTVAS